MGARRYICLPVFEKCFWGDGVRFEGFISLAVLFDFSYPGLLQSGDLREDQLLVAFVL